MEIVLKNLKPCYMSESEVTGSDIYLIPEFRFEKGKRYMVCARSGHGKTSLLNFIYGVSHRFDGSIEYRGFDGVGTLASSAARPMPEHQLLLLRRRALSLMFQDLCLFDELTAFENVQLKNRLTGFKTDAEIRAMLDTLLPSAKKDQPVRTLSLGQRQRMAAVRAMCQPFAFLLLDEPFSHLDHQSAAQVAELIARETEKQEAALIVTALDPTSLFHFDATINL